ncbi:DUF898 family protein [Mangrovicoccus algicola]|uniref:DUF898 family protein n=1 Tax=Mangrovicoccus algicola TaxID=2771008 RepID=A0A8J6Z2U3_9RHOB|nr:DUF898 family protein [Mangrovicoccus algicola]MBE3640641.1 DUF898 family protein [Mangrovicoccus algicola]
MTEIAAGAPGQDDGPGTGHGPGGRPADALAGAYRGGAPALFRLALWTSLLTVLTLGVYRFWARTRIRRRIWSSIAPGGEPLEYTGTGREKFLGFLVAFVILALCLGGLAMVALFLGLSLFVPDGQGGMILAPLLQNSLLLLSPLYFYAEYRARRYMLSRTSWRGIRFGMDKGGWGYAWRACGYWLLTGATLGALLPLMTFKLEEYRTNRSWFGDARFTQGGEWTMLYRAMVPIFEAIGFAVIAGALAVFAGGGLSLLMLAGIAAMALRGVICWRIRSFAILTRHKRLGGDIRIGTMPSEGRLGWRWVAGWVCIGVIYIPAVALAVALQAYALGEGAAADLAALPLLGTALAAVALLVLFRPLRLALVVQPVLAHLVEASWVETPGRLTSIRQRARGGPAEADGLADALDLGGAI